MGIAGVGMASRTGTGREVQYGVWVAGDCIVEGVGVTVGGGLRASLPDSI